MSATLVFMLIVNLYDEVPVCSWNGVERVFAVVGSVYRNFLFVERFVEVVNSSATPESSFEVVKGSLLSADIPVSATIVGFAHTHPPAHYHPSDNDIDGLREGMFGAVLCDGIVVWYDNKGERLSITHIRY
ncbi:MAG: hypothetical protein EBU84_03425 [Actinobacteria bacterium]|nr:hypothetical protein [Actinomycetota bacterium]